jgi:hypothetical protein
VTGSESSLTHGSELKYGLDVVGCQFGKLLEYLLTCHAPGKVLEHVVDGDARASYAWFAGANRRIDRNVIHQILHACSIVAYGSFIQRRISCGGSEHSASPATNLDTYCCRIARISTCGTFLGEESSRMRHLRTRRFAKRSRRPGWHSPLKDLSVYTASPGATASPSASTAS